MGVEQVRRPVQRRHRLTGARPALHHQRPLQPGPDHPVLLGLDGGHHVAHPAGAAPAQRGQQRRLAHQRAAIPLAHPLQVEHLVVDPDHDPVLQVQVAAPYQAAGIGRGGHVERPRRRRPPVDQHRLVPLVAQADPADVRAQARPVVHAAEAQSPLDRVQLRQPPRLLRGQRLALHHRLACSRAGAPGVHLAQRRLGALPGDVEQVVEPRHSALLAVKGLRKTILTTSHSLVYSQQEVCERLACRHAMFELSAAPQARAIPPPHPRDVTAGSRVPIATFQSASTAMKAMLAAIPAEHSSRPSL